MVAIHFMKTLDEVQPQEQAGFRQGINCLGQIQTVSRVIEVPPPPHHTHCKGDATKRYCMVEAVQDGYITLRRKYENSVGTFAPVREATDQELHAHLFDLKVLPAAKTQ
ncbi:hypothetical protein RB195_012056 [Necator americanus]|uniref:Uncharacterized protein n=1 Tax=Necator americanus TaxID=51031 RepID=A0ABR1D5B8_NECAM